MDLEPNDFNNEENISNNNTNDEWYCYLLINDSNNASYVGVTKNIHRRLRQHNREISGGAKATIGKHWRRVCYVENFPNSTAALQFEWKWKNITKKVWNITHNVLFRRLEALLRLGNSEKSTEKSDLFINYTNKLILNIEEPEIIEFYKNKTIKYIDLKYDYIN
jgi:predicted GIY-YIG superfamily endonuclease